AIKETAKIINFEQDSNKVAEGHLSEAESLLKEGYWEEAQNSLAKANEAHAAEEKPEQLWMEAQRQARKESIQSKIEELKNEGKAKEPEADRIPPVEGESVEPTAKEQVKEGTPQREGEAEKEVRIGAAAWRNERTGEVFYGKDHQDALEKARIAAQDPANKDKVVAADLPKVDTTKAENRETPDFGFISTDGEFMSRVEAQKFAEQSGQFKGKKTDRPVMHSNEVQMDFFEKKAPKPSEATRQLPGAATKAEFTESRLSDSVKAIEDAEKSKGRALDVNNEGDKRAWMEEINKRFDRGTFSLDELNSLWNQSHEAYRIRNAAGKTIPIEQAVKQIGGERIQSQRILAAQMQDVRAEIGTYLLPYALRLSQIVSDLLQRFRDLDEGSKRLA
ncbi:hypothetical protein EBT16_14105, partial [bacterium]|nr:hypothetical protein [bacterium]